MASSLRVVSADDITIDEFKRLLGQYAALIKTVSDAKGVKDGQRTLEELDEYRYNDALDIFSSEGEVRPMKLDDIKTLVEWKLRHGKFRPTLMKLVSSNDPADAQDVIKQAREKYSKNTDVDAALGVLTKLKGIGPATASLLLAVHDASRVIFFADEAFWWLCCNGKQSPIKYNVKEYRMLCSKTNDLRDRLGVQASDVEKVAYVLMKQSGQPEQSHDVAPSKRAKQSTSSTATKTTKKRKPDSKPEKVENVTHEQPSLRRSKRVKT
ncbi:hypothetical protein FSARC_11777 [Fusarium sarcochroum]|uniref:Uncharacterized protein n=1 Tax=Fusarium sarcochroum TaxID=1208366 RepID=A0A8H4TD57_9HYPO|nr:hypothetical protein FSARC_11777 [Fusarium sarcochroum]